MDPGFGAGSSSTSLVLRSEAASALLAMKRDPPDVQQAPPLARPASTQQAHMARRWANALFVVSTHLLPQHATAVIPAAELRIGPSGAEDSPPTYHTPRQRIDSILLSGEQRGFKERRRPLSPIPRSPHDSASEFWVANAHLLLK